jgi:hypothetical protein
MHHLNKFTEMFAVLQDPKLLSCSIYKMEQNQMKECQLSLADWHSCFPRRATQRCASAFQFQTKQVERAQMMQGI